MKYRIRPSEIHRDGTVFYVVEKEDRWFGWNQVGNQWPMPLEAAKKAVEELKGLDKELIERNL